MNFNNPWIDARVTSVRAADLRAYLLRRDWKLRPYPRPQVLLWEGPLADDGEPITQLVPANERGSDYLQCVNALIANLAVLEDRPAVEVLNDILREASAPSPPLPNGPGGPVAVPSRATPTEP